MIDVNDESRLLLDLAQGKYDSEIAAVRRLLRLAGKFWPPALLADKALGLAVWLNWATAPSAIVPDGRGGAVPVTNSRVHPSNGRFIKWIDGRWKYDDFFGGEVTETLPPPSK